MKSCAIIACDNGLGHVRRCFLIGRELAKHGIRTDLFAPSAKYKKFEKLFNPDPLLRNIDFATHTTAESLMKGERVATHWHQRLPHMADYDAVLCDNLPEILNIRTDAILSGHFLWHHAIEGINPLYREAAQNLIHRFKPTIIASKLFATIEISSLLNYMPVGLYVSDHPRIEDLSGGNLLISGGSTSAMHSDLGGMVERLFNHGEEPFETVFIDPGIMSNKKFCKKKNLPSWIRIADYSPVMYRAVTAAVCRPGVGTVTDLLQQGGRPFCVYENRNNELTGNAIALASARVGCDCKFPEIALKQAKEYASDLSARSRHIQALSEVDFDGVSAAVRIICNEILCT